MGRLSWILWDAIIKVLIRERHEGQAWRGDLAMEAETGVKPVEYRRRDQNPKDVPSGS